MTAKDDGVTYEEPLRTAEAPMCTCSTDAINMCPACRRDSASAQSDEERARTWARAIWEDPNDEYAKVMRLIAEIRADERRHACAENERLRSASITPCRICGHEGGERALATPETGHATTEKA